MRQAHLYACLRLFYQQKKEETILRKVMIQLGNRVARRAAHALLLLRILLFLEVGIVQILFLVGNLRLSRSLHFLSAGKSSEAPTGI